jgi:hypothetical protein
VQYAGIQPDGDVGTFAAATSLPAGRAWHGCAAYNGYLYVISGASAGTAVADVLYAKINSNGSLGSWSTASHGLNTARVSFYATAYSGHLYVFGGSVAGVGVKSVEYAAIGTDGDLGAFTELADKLTSFRQIHSGALWDGYVYLVGGRKDGTTDFNTVEYAQLSSAGGVGAFTECASTFLDSRENLECAAYSGYLYVIAGYSIDSLPEELSDIQYAEIDPLTGGIGAFSTTAETMTGHRWHGGAGVYNHRLYLIGGGTAVSWPGDVEYARFALR